MDLGQGNLATTAGTSAATISVAARPGFSILTT
jgi:hypothetical protein